MARDRPDDPLQQALAPVLERIRRDRKLAPAQVRIVFSVLLKHLLKAGLDARQTWQKAGIKSHSQRALFSAATRQTLAHYIRTRRIEVAAWLLHHTELSCEEIGQAVGYTEYSTFNNACKKVYGPEATPLKIRKAGPLASWSSASRESGREAGRALVQRLAEVGPLDAAGIRQFLRELVALDPRALRAMSEICAELGCGPQLVIDGALHEELYAAGMWARIQDLPYARQRRQVSSCERFRTPAFFDLLRRKARLEGRRDRQRGIRLAELAVLSLHGGEPVFGPKVHDLRALGLATLANQHRLAGDLTEAVAAFEASDLAWREPGAPHDAVIAAEITMLRAALKTSLRLYEQALEFIDGARDLFQREGHAEHEAEALAQRGAILIYAGRDDDAVTSLLEARRLVVPEEQPHLAYAVASALAYAYANLENYSAAEAELERAERHLAKADYPLGVCEMQHLAGFVKHRLGDLRDAESLYSEARQGFIEGDAVTWLALANIDLALLYADRGEWSNVLDLAAEAVPMLEPLKLHQETVAAVELLASGHRCDRGLADIWRPV